LSFEDVYKNQVALLLEVLPVLNEFTCFALKGGTAINLFIQDMPRLSVDIDLTYFATLQPLICNFSFKGNYL